MSSRVQLVFFVFNHVFCPIRIMAEKCLTSNMPVFTGYWIVFGRSAELKYEIRNWGGRVYTVFQVSASLKIWMEVQVEVGCACAV